MEDKRILICYNEPVNFYSNYIGKNPSSAEDNIDLSESEFTQNLDLIKTSLLKNFTTVECLGINSKIKNAVNAITSFNPDLIFNFVESIEGDTHYESFITGMFDILGISYTGNNSLCLGNCLNKIRTKQILWFSGVNTPAYQILEAGIELNEKSINLKYPIIIKLITEDASIGISENSVVYDFTDLKKQCDFLFDTYNKDLILEQYISGRELNISVLNGKTLPISEINFKGLPKDFPKIVTYEAKWSPGSLYYKYSLPECPAKLPSNLEEKITETAMSAYKALGCRDYARVDIRLTKQNTPYVIEVNPNPDISPDSGFIRSTKAAGIGYDELLVRLADCAMEREI